MPVNRRRSATQIAKVNARSIDGFFGVGTDCFFIRGTVLSDVHVDGEYRTLTIQRPGNVIEVEAFDGEWATVSVMTRTGNRPGDNIRARLFLRDVDLRTVGIDCAGVMSGVDIFDQPAQEEPFAPIEPPAEPLLAVPLDPAPHAEAPAHEEEHPHAIEAGPMHDWLALATRSLLVDGRLFVEIGASMIAIALPVMLYFLREMFLRRDDG